MKKKKRIYNWIMAGAVLLMAGAGVMIAGNLQGWFDRDSGTKTEALADGGQVEVPEDAVVVVSEKTGDVNIERKGIAYKLDEGTKLRNGDILQTLRGASVMVELGEDMLWLDQNSEVKFQMADGEIPVLNLTAGQVFADIRKSGIKVLLGETEVTAGDGVFSAGILAGSANVYVFGGELRAGEEKVEAGWAVSVLESGETVEKLSIHALNAFLLERVQKTDASRSLCFTGEEIEQLGKDREEEKSAALLAMQKEEESRKEIEAQRQKNRENDIKESSASENDGYRGEPSGTQQGTEGKKPQKGASDGKGGDSSGGEAEEPEHTCTIEIRCDTILENMEELKEGKSAYVPSNGVILSTSEVEFQDGDTVFDVLKNACSLADIQLEYSWTPMYDSYYVEGINQLYEFDCGNESGWMYKVNGWFPNYGCSAYTVEDGDVIVWNYTCNGLGEDVGR